MGPHDIQFAGWTKNAVVAILIPIFSIVVSACQSSGGTDASGSGQSHSQNPSSQNSGGTFPISEGDGVFFSATDMVISDGGTTKISWYAPDAASCEAAGGWSGSRANFGEEFVSPARNTEFSLTCTNGKGESATRSFTVKIKGRIDFDDRPVTDQLYDLDTNDPMYRFYQPPVGRTYKVPTDYPTIADAFSALNDDGDGSEFAYSYVILEPGEYDCSTANVKVKYVVVQGSDRENRATCLNSGITARVEADYIVVQNLVMKNGRLVMTGSLEQRRGVCHSTAENVWIYGDIKHAMNPPHCWSQWRDETSYMRAFNSDLGPTNNHNTYCSGIANCIAVSSRFHGTRRLCSSPLVEPGEPCTEEPLAKDISHNYHSIGFRNYMVGNLFEGKAAWNLDIAGCSISYIAGNEFVVEEDANKAAIGLTGQRPSSHARDEDNIRCSRDPDYASVLIENNAFYNHRMAPLTGSYSSAAISASQSSQPFRVRDCPASDPNVDSYWCIDSVQGDHDRATRATVRNNLVVDFPRFCIECQWLDDLDTNTIAWEKMTPP